MTEQTAPPIREFRAGCIRASVWANKREIDGRTVVQHNVRIEKRFFDEKKQEWKTSDCYFVDELPRLRVIADRAFEFIAMRQEHATPETSP